MSANGQSAAVVIREAARPLRDRADDYDSLIERVGGARVVLIGESSHGTHEFYRERARITRRLIRERGFSAVAVEADWPDAYRVSRWVRGGDEDSNADEALAGFRRFPTWMWRNREVLAFVDWLREHNAGRGKGDRRVGFYGIDLYSLFASIAAVLKYLDRVDPDAAARARYRFACFEHFGADAQAYGYAAGFDLDRSCEDEAVAQLMDVRRRAAEVARRDGRLVEDAAFDAEQNARVVKDAERYYRTMFRGSTESWNLRDKHMVETLEALLDHLGPSGRVVVWAHNSHVGDARATSVSDRGQWNIGQLARERFSDEAALIGFTTYSGTVTAASAWGGPAERKRVRPSLERSYGALFHAIDYPRFLLIPGDEGSRVYDALEEPRLERAIGVVYLPESERVSHYFDARLARQFDAVIHIDETRAVEPMERTSEWESGEVPETFPAGL